MTDDLESTAFAATKLSRSRSLLHRSEAIRTVFAFGRKSVMGDEKVENSG